MNNQIHSQGSQRLSTSVSLYFLYCHFDFHFIVKPTLLNLLLLFFLNAYLLTFLKSNRQSKIYLLKPNLEFSASRGEINFYKAYFHTGAAPVLSTVPSNHGLFTLSLLILCGDISLNPGPQHIHSKYVAKQWEKPGAQLCARSVQSGFTKHARILKILTSKPWRSTHHTLGHVATAAWQVFPRQCFHLVLLPVTDLIRYLTFLLPPLETQQAHKLHLPICPASVFPCTCLVLLIRRQSKRKEI